MSHQEIIIYCHFAKNAFASLLIFSTVTGRVPIGRSPYGAKPLQAYGTLTYAFISIPWSPQNLIQAAKFYYSYMCEHVSDNTAYA